MMNKITSAGIKQNRLVLLLSLFSILLLLREMADDDEDIASGGRPPMPPRPPDFPNREGPTYEEDGDVWSAITDYESLLRTNVSFLQGDLKATPYHLGPICDETLPLVPNLIKLHSRGFLTIGGQPTMIEEPDIQDYGWDGGSNRWFKNEYSEQQQKAFIEFLIPNRPEYTNLIWYLMMELAWQSDAYKVVISRGDLVYSNLVGTYELTRYRVAPTSDSLQTHPWHIQSNMTAISMADSMPHWFGNYSNLNSITDDCWSVFICMKEWGVGDLEAELLKLCDQFKIPKYDNIVETKSTILDVWNLCVLDLSV